MQPHNPVQGAPAAAERERRVAWVACGLCCLALIAAGLFPVNNPDTFGHLAQGRQIAELGHVPSHDTFSFWQARPAPWRNYEWLSDLIGWQLYRLGGFDALIALKCATLAAAGALLCALGWLLGGARAVVLSALLITAAIPAARFRFTERPHLVALPLAALYLIGFSYLMRAWGRASRRADALWIAGLGCAHVLWVNLHGSHLLGLALTLVHVALGFAERATRARLLAVLGLQLAASCVSPYGPAILIDAIEHTLDPRYRELVTEWEPWSPTDPLWLIAAPVLQTVLLAIVVRSLLRAGPAGRALLGTSCLLALAAFRSIRFVAEYLLISAPAIAIGAGALLAQVAWPRFARASAAAAVAVCTGATLGAARLPPYAGFGGGLNETGLPAASGSFLAERTRSPRVLAAVDDAWYLMFAVPQARFLVDGRIPFYGTEHLERVRQAFASGAALSALLERYHVDTVVARHTYAPQRELMRQMLGRPGWLLATVEDRYSLFVRQEIELRGGAQLRPIALQPGYELDWLLDADPARERAILGALAQLPEHESNRGYRSWVRAVLATRPLRRQGGHAGLRAAANPAEAARLEQAQRWLARAARGAEGVPVVHAYHALVAAARCDLDAAERALDAARWEGESRETLLGAQEVALRRGERAQVAAFLRQAQAMPEATHDAWLAALREGLRSAPRCP